LKGKGKQRGRVQGASYVRLQSRRTWKALGVLNRFETSLKSKSRKGFRTKNFQGEYSLMPVIKRTGRIIKELPEGGRRG